VVTAENIDRLRTLALRVAAPALVTETCAKYESAAIVNNVDEITNEFARELRGYIGGFVAPTRTVCHVLGKVNVV